MRRMISPDTLRRSLRRLIDGRAPADPLYLSNRTLGQKLRPVILLGLPVLVVGAVLAVVLVNRVTRDVSRPPAVYPAEKAVQSPPELSRPIRVTSNPDLEVVEAAIEQGAGTYVTGTIRNKGEHSYPYVTLVFDVTDATGSQLGGVTTAVEKLAPGSTTRFRFPIKQTRAAIVLVREVIVGKE